MSPRRILVCLGLAATAVGGPGIRASAGPREAEAFYRRLDQLHHLRDQFDAAPAWGGMSSDKVPEMGPALMAAIEQCATLKEADLRRLVWQLLEKHKGDPNREFRTWSKVFVLNRFYFAVPSSELKEKAVYFGGWEGVPHDGESIDLLWPLRTEADGHLKLAGVFGGFMGPDYRGLEEFDHFSTRYGVRTPPARPK